MSKNPNVEKAAQALAIMPPSLTVNSYFGDIADTLDRCGLLVTPLMQRAVEACKEHARRFGINKGPSCAEHEAVTAVGREALALEEAKKPKERFAVASVNGVWCVLDSEPTKNVYAHNLTESQARAVAKALNECDR